jgi:tetratricopeptide (TPR) repeat protein
VLAYLGRENAARGNHAEAVEFYDRYLTSDASWDDERAQIHRQAGQSLLAIGELDRAERLALDALAIAPDWPDSYLTLAEVAHERKDWQKAIAFARRVEQAGIPETLLIINPLDYSALPHVVQASAYAGLTDWQNAIRHGHAALAADSGRQDVAHGLAVWESMSERNRVAEQFVAMAQTLVAHDEQGKALVLLEQAVPYFSVDHPLVVQARSQVRERLLWAYDPAAYAKHYQDGGSKPEDMVQDYAGVCEHLPRAGFLLEGLREQETGA